jgi:hypothetical protein
MENIVQQYSKKYRKTISIIKISGLVVVPIVLLLLPANFFDDGDTVVCLSRSLFDMYCPGCGLTRACMHFIHFEFEEAAHFNQLSFVIMPILMFVWGREFLREVNYQIQLRKKNTTNHV